MLVAKNMAEVRHFAHIVKVAPRSDVIVLVTCFALTVLFDMVLSVSVGVVLAALLFMRRMAEIADVHIDEGTMAKLELPDGVLLYEIAGPLFFGAAERAMSAFDSIEKRKRPHALILYMGQVPAVDATGLVALETLIAKLQRMKIKVILAGMRKQPSAVVARAGIKRDPGKLAIAPDLDSALSIAVLHAARSDEVPHGAAATT
jgi:SulP family sulfate permease